MSRLVGEVADGPALRAAIAEGYGVELDLQPSLEGEAMVLSGAGGILGLAAAQGKLRVEGMSVYAQWFEDGLKLIM